MKRVTIAIAAGLLLSVLPLRAEPARFDTVGNAAALLGLDLKTVFERFGVPSGVTTVRGEAPWQDDVVFVYPEGLSLFFFQDRVWQVRLDRNFPEALLGLSMGVPRGRVEELFGPPFGAEEDWILYHFAGGAFPVRVRFFFDARGLEDVYVYRGDF
jgi:hypothetical protein